MDNEIQLRLDRIERLAEQIQCDVRAIYGYCAGMEAVAKDYPLTPPQTLVGYGNQPKSALQEIKEMIVELKIKGSIRERANGLIELRTQAFGSIYGRTKDEIETKLTKALKEAKEKKSKNKKNDILLLSEFFNTNYLPYKKTEVSSRTYESYVTYLQRIIKDGFDKALNKYSTADIEKYLLSIQQTRTRQVLRGVLNNMFTYAKRIGVIKNNPMDNVEQVKHTKKVGRALSFEAQEMLINNLYEDNSIDIVRKAYITFVYLTGTRRNEALSLSVSDIDFEKKILHISGTKTKGSNRFMPLTPSVENLFKKITPDNSGRYFPFASHTSHDIMEKIADEYHLHELRHTFGTIGICALKIDAKTISLWMGHSTVAMTLTTYTHPEQLDMALFYDGSKSEEEKVSIMREKYQNILDKINKFWA